ncbi:hypothetical protein NLX83_27320 [Allokutzneria sp. A3M-2-11 16]|uniref:hypothetical protein n=1 Tax=Allokutzneria sp. A3M-2-11 16 TaxID=2962043 RepID=UPI0020B7FEEF|nr:hypothetical protein [Allokutzneria sp. A3M-2-11 16]MCP3802990.1 hypothetical protein [Allokutzneria sp. A3M-2-11 16]
MLLTEYRRGVGVLLTPVIALVVWLGVFGAGTPWPGPWLKLAETVHQVSVEPFVIAAAVWQAGRERRRGTRDLLSVTPRARWQRLSLSWASIVLGGALGVLLPLLVGTVLVALHDGYMAPGWWWLIVNTFLGIGFHAAVGTVVGVLVPSPLLGLVGAVAAYVALFGTSLRGVLLLGQTPIAGWPPPPDFRVPNSGPQVLMALWLVMSTAALIAVVSQHRAAFVVIPVALALAVVLHARAENVGWFWRVDQHADELICRDNVCVLREDLHQLDLVFAAAKPVLDKVSGIPGAPTTAVPGEGATHLWVARRDLDWSGKSVRDPGDTYFRRTLVWSVVHHPESCSAAADLSRVAGAWWLADPGMLEASTDSAALLDRLNRLDVVAQRKWFGDFLAAVRRCDEPALMALR